MHSINKCMHGWEQIQLSRMLSNFSVKKMYRWGFAYMLNFAFMHHPYLVCIAFGMPSLHFSCIFDVNLKIDVNLSYS